MKERAEIRHSAVFILRKNLKVKWGRCKNLLHRRFVYYRKAVKFIMKKISGFLIAFIMLMSAFTGVLSEPVGEVVSTEKYADKEEIKKALENSGLSDITKEISDYDRLQMQNLLGILTVADSGQITGAMTEDEQIELAATAVRTANYNTGLKPLQRYSAEFGGTPELYSMSSFENLVYRLSGIKFDLVSHDCKNSTCILNEKNEVGAVDRRAVGMERRRTGVILNIPQQSNVNYCIIDSVYSLPRDKFIILYNNYNAVVDVEEDKDYYDENNILTSISDAVAEPQNSVFTYAVVGKRIYNGALEYYLTEQGGKNVKVEHLMKYITEELPKSSVSFDYSEVAEYTEISQYTEYLDSVIKGKKIKDPEKREIAKYLEYASEHISEIYMDVNENAVTVTADIAESASKMVKKTVAEFEKILNQKSIVLNEKIDTAVRVNVKDTDLQEGLTVTFDTSLLNIIDGIDKLKVLYRGNIGVTIKGEDLKTLIAAGNMSFNIVKAVSGYDISFSDGEAKKITKLTAPVTIAFESDVFDDTIYFKRDGEGEIFGGHNNMPEGTIEFNVQFPGNYYVNVNSKDFSDISGLSESEKNAVEYMVSKGYFELEDGKFNPYRSLSRNEYAKILSGVYGYTDKYAICDFSDVDIKNEYYDYIASVYQNGILTGYADNTFRGEKTVTKGELIDQVTKFLKLKRNSIYPVNTNEYVDFADSILEPAADVALAVREGIIEKGGIYAPDSTITRVEAAVMFYNMLEDIYGITPEENVKILESTSTEEEKSGVLPIIICILAMGVAIGTGVHVYRNRKRY